MSSFDSFLGFDRRDLSRGVGIRNLILVVQLTPCVRSWTDPNALKRYERLITSDSSCTYSADQVSQMRLLLTNPNVGGVVFVGMGCGSVGEEELFDDLRTSKVPIETLDVGNFGGVNEFRYELRRCLDRLSTLCELNRTSVPVSELMIASKCGGSDYSNGSTSNKVIAQILERLTSQRSICLVGEAAELIGIHDNIEGRIIDNESRQEFNQFIDSAIAKLKCSGSARTQMVRGNIEGGLFTVEEKARSSAAKFDGLVFKKVIGTRETLTNTKVQEKGGLILQLGDHQEPKVMTEFAFAGAVGVLFATGRGGGFCHPVVPSFVISASGHNRLVRSRLVDLLLDRKTEIPITDFMLDEFFKTFVEWLSGQESGVENERLFSFDWAGTN